MSKSSSELSKYLDVAELLERDLQKAEWDNKRLPSVRKVAKQYGVSIVTASRSLQVLRDKGIIRTIERSGCYRVPKPDAEKFAVILRLTKGSMVGLTTNLVRGGFESVAKELTVNMYFDAFDLHDGLTTEMATHAAKQAKENGIKGVVMLPSRKGDEAIEAERAFVLGCQAAELPIVLFERYLAGNEKIECDCVCVNDINNGEQATTYLYETNRKNVSCLIASNVSSHRERMAGYMLAHFEHTNKPPIILKETNNPDCYTQLANEIIKQKIDGVVCYSDYSALALIVELQKRGKDIPKDVGVVGMDNLLIGEPFTVQLTTMDYPAEQMAKVAISLLKARVLNPKLLPIKSVIANQLIIRGST